MWLQREYFKKILLNESLPVSQQCPIRIVLVNGSRVRTYASIKKATTSAFRECCKFDFLLEYVKFFQSIIFERIAKCSMWWLPQQFIVLRKCYFGRLIINNVRINSDTISTLIITSIVVMYLFHSFLLVWHYTSVALGYWHCTNL